MNSPVAQLQARLGLHFRSPHLLEAALQHSSYAHDSNERDAGPVAGACGGNERLEFLGDAVLQLVVSEYLYVEYSTSREGQMSRLRSRLVCEAALAAMALRFDLGHYLKLGKAEIHMFGQFKPSLLADTLEAVIGAVYLDQGLDQAKAWIRSWLGDLLKLVETNQVSDDYKTELQEIIQGTGRKTPTYETKGNSGPDHAPQFEVAVMVEGQELARGCGSSKKRAAQSAAQKALENLKNEQRIEQE